MDTVLIVLAGMFMLGVIWSLPAMWILAIVGMFICTIYGCVQAAKGKY